MSVGIVVRERGRGEGAWRTIEIMRNESMMDIQQMDFNQEITAKGYAPSL